MPVSSSTEHWIKPDALTINLNHFGDPDYLQVSVLAGAVVMAFKQDVIGYNAAHNYRTWPLEAANTYFETSSAYNVYARLTRSEVNARALVVYDPILRDIEGREITYDKDEETGEEIEILGEPDPDYFFVFLGEISTSLSESGISFLREWSVDFRFGTLDTNQFQNEEAGGEWTKMFRLNKVTDLIDVLKAFSNAAFKRLSIKRNDKDKPITDIKRTIDSDEEYLRDEKGDILKDEEGNHIKNPDYVPVSDETIPTTAWVEKQTSEKYLKKYEPDFTEHLIKFLGGLEVGESIIDFANGKGTVVTPDGLVQTDRMEVRGSAIFKELIFNRIQAQEGDTSYSENGLVEECTLMEDGTYMLTLQKRWENDFTAFKEGDILYGDVNNLFSTGEYYTSWVRVLHVDTAANIITVIPYSDSQVPGGVNHAPETQMRLVRRGNAIDKTRQSYWYLSATTEKCFIWLEGVDKPIIEEYNYYVMIGRPKRLELFANLPIDYEQSYIFARGAIIEDLHRVNFEGKPIKQLNDRGFWSLETAQSDHPYTSTNEIADTVWHYGCRWQCLVTGTTQEPKFSASEWAMVEGNPTFVIDVNSTNNYVFDMDVISKLNSAGQYDVFTTLIVTGTLYNQDVTEHILDTDCSWTRDTGNVTEDNAWAIKRASAGKELALTVEDLGTNYNMMRSCTFKVTALLRDGQQFEMDTYEITF